MRASYWLALLLCILFALSITACGSSSGDDDDDSSADDDDDDTPDYNFDDDDSADDDDDDTTDDDDDDTTDDDDLPYVAPDGFEVVFFDVGQGDAALVRFPEGSTMLIDGGEKNYGNNVILPYFDDLHLHGLDYMVASHAHSDHCGGLDEVLYDVTLGEFWDSGLDHTTTAWQDVLDTVDDAGADRIDVQEGYTRQIDGCDVLVLSSDQGFGGSDALNANSIVLTIDCEDQIVMFTGDATETTEARLIADYGFALYADVMKVAHHGSPDRDSDFPTYAQSSYAVFSVGEDNPYGHPDSGNVSEWQTEGAAIYRTDQDGNIIFLAKDGAGSVTTEF